MSLPTVSYNASTFAAAGTLNVTPPGENHVERTSFAGALAGTYKVVLVIDGAHFPGDRIMFCATWPITVANIVVNFYNGSIAGTQLATFSTDGVNLTGVFEFVFNSSFAWEYQKAKVPA